MKVLGFANRNSGCGFHRVIMPLAMMQDVQACICVVPRAEVIQEGFDVLLYNRQSVWDNNWKKIKNELGIKIVMDLDDGWVLPYSHAMFETYWDLREKIENNIRYADLVTCTNERLADKIRPFNTNVTIIPNGIPFGYQQYHQERRDNERVRIFWAGGDSHERDLKILSNPIKRLIPQSKKILMVLAGYVENETWKGMFRDFTGGGRLPYKKYHGTEPNQYMIAYEDADIMVIPLEETEWHSCKSNLKLLEAACKKLAVVVSRVEPYSLDSDAPVLWVDKQTDWFEHLNFLINNEQARKELGERLYEWAKAKYNLTEINERRRTIFESLIEAPALL